MGWMIDIYISICQNGILRAGETAQVVRIELDLHADFAGRDTDRIKKLSSFIDKRGKGFFHADGTASAMDISGGSKKDLLGNHLDRFFAAGGSCALEIECCADGNDEDIKRAAFALGDERLEDCLRILAQLRSDRQTIDALIRIIIMDAVGNCCLFCDAHNVGFDCFSHEEKTCLSSGGAIVTQICRKGKNACVFVQIALNRIGEYGILQLI